MTAEAVQALVQDTIRLRSQSLELFASCRGLVVESRQLRVRRRALSGVHAQHESAGRLIKLHRRIERRLRSGRLPYASAPIVSGFPGDGGICDACDQTLRAGQLVMMVPVRDAFVHLHADCYLVWNEERTAARSA